MNKIIVIVILVLSLTLNINISSAAPAVGSGFTYQGELIDGGTPANGDYDVKLDLYLTLTGGGSSGTLSFNNVTVTNGLFTIEDVDFGDAVYADHNQFYVEVAVKVAGGANFSNLTPRQWLQAVPYAVQAEFLATPGSNGDVLQFNGSDWVANAVNVNSPWTDNGTSVSYLGRVGVGVTNNLFGFQVKGSGTQHPFEVTDASGVGIMRITDTGNIGIRTTVPQAGLHIFSPSGESPLKIDVAASTALSIDGNGRSKMGNDINIPLFNAKLAINEADGAHPLSVKRNGLLELLVESDGGVSIGSNFTGSFPPQLAPDQGLYVAGDFKTSTVSNGIMRYMVAAFCGGGGTTIQRSYTTFIAPGGATSISNAGVGICDITFPTTVNDRFLLSSALNGTSTAKAVNCSFLTTDTVRCRRYGTTNSIASSGNISLFIY